MLKTCLSLHLLRCYISQSHLTTPHPTFPSSARSKPSLPSGSDQKFELKLHLGSNQPASLVLVKGPLTRISISGATGRAGNRQRQLDRDLTLNHSTEPSTKQTIDPCSSKLANQVSTAQATQDLPRLSLSGCHSQTNSTFFSALHLRALPTSRAD